MIIKTTGDLHQNRSFRLEGISQTEGPEASVLLKSIFTTPAPQSWKSPA